MTEQPWLLLREVCHLYGVNYATAKNKVAYGTFDVPTYKVGKQIVIDREVHEAFFRSKREEGLRLLANSTSR